MVIAQGIECPPLEDEPYDRERPVPIIEPHPSTWRPEPGTVDELVWEALLDCDQSTDPTATLKQLFESRGMNFDDVLPKLSPQVRELYQVTLDGFEGKYDD